MKILMVMDTLIMYHVEGHGDLDGTLTMMMKALSKKIRHEPMHRDITK